MLKASLSGCLLGTAIGDALGLPYEGLSPRRATRLLGPPDRYRLIVGRGMISDDTEHACITAQALIASAGDPREFTVQLARRLRRWLFALPPGIGYATLRAIARMAVGISPEKSGVRSAGNGAAMRAAILGAAVSDPDQLRELVHRSSIMTHRDPRAEHGTFAVALAARHARAHRDPDPAACIAELEEALPPSAAELLESIGLAAQFAADRRGVTQFAKRIGLDEGVTGYINHTVPVAICAWLHHPRDLKQAVIETIRCGGDTDTVAAIAGGIVGAGTGAEGLPRELVEGVRDWPRNVAWMTALGDQLERVMSSGLRERPVEVAFAATAARNVVLLVIVLVHGLRRVLPPY